jgi:hypothetical protein
VDRDVDDRHGEVVEDGQDQPQRPDDGAVDERRPVGAVPRTAGGHELTAQRDVVADRSRRFVGAVGAASGGPHLAPVDEAVVVRAELDDLRG